MMTILNIFVHNIYNSLYNLKRTVKSLLKDLFVFKQRESGGRERERGREGGEKNRIGPREDGEGESGKDDAMGRENDLVGSLGRRFRRRRELH